MARLILSNAGEDVDVGGDVTVIGTTSGGEVITVLRGRIVLDPSFNAGGDMVRLPDDARYFTIRRSGSTVIIEGLDVSVTIPVGATGLQVSFKDVTRTLLFDVASSVVRLGDQTVTTTKANVAPAGPPATLTGTEASDSIAGTGDNDVIDGLGGADSINGGAGNDIIRGGAGGDDLDGSFGSDQIFGGPDADRITDNDGASNFLDGGTGNDWIGVTNYAGTRFDLIGGDGDDYIEVSIGQTGTCVIDAGAGADRVVVSTAGIPISASLGAGRDQLVLGEYALDDGQFGVITVTDFQAGASGDTVEFLRALSTFTLGWDQSGNPFSSGHLRLIDRDGTAVLQVDRDGASGQAHGFRDLILFRGGAVSAFDKENLEGFDPRQTTLQSGLGAEDTGFEHRATGLAMWEHQAFA